jgi:hypothetical protein
MSGSTNRWLVAGGSLSTGAALLHIACIVGGPDWYRFFGAGEQIAQMAERGHWYPPIVTLFIATILAIWAAYAFSGAGFIRRLPLLRAGLVAISAVYLVRGLAIVPILAMPTLRTPFNIWSSLIVLVYGIIFSIGTIKAWPKLTHKEAIA